MTSFRQLSFSSGEISPALYSRVDLSKYQTGLKTCKNFIVQRHGGVSNRPGTEFVCEVKDSTKNVALIEFVFNNDQTYMLEFGDLYFRVIRNGAQVTDLTLTITGITKSNPAVVTYTGTDPSEGNEFILDAIQGMIELNGRNLKIANVDGALNTFELRYLDGSNVNSSAYGTYLSGGTANRVYTVTTPYAYTDLPELQFVQSADVITLVHPSYAPRDLSRTAHAVWTLSLSSFSPDIARPTALSGSTAAGAGGLRNRYKVTATADETYEESLVALAATKAITGLTGGGGTAAVTITIVAHGYQTGDEVYIASVGGMTQINNQYWFITRSSADVFVLTGVDGTAFNVWTAGGTTQRNSMMFDALAAPTAAVPYTITWTDVAGANDYTIYKELNGIFGFIGTSGSSQFADTGITPDTSDTPPIERNPFLTNFPSTVTYYQQRKGYANTNADTEKIYFSRTGKFNNFTTTSPISSDDAVTFSMAGRQVNEVKHLLDLGSLVVFTSSGEYAITGGDGGVLSPTTINPKQYSYNGANSLPPIVIASTALYTQARGSVVRDLGFDYQIDGYKGNDLTIFSTHLFDNKTLVDWCYQQTPNSVVWAARDDGVLLGLTYVREHQVWAWHRHEFENGLVENVASIPEGNEDFLYVVVNRTVDDREVRYIERMSSRFVEDIKDVTILDSFLTYDGRNTDDTHTMTLSGSGWTYNDTLILTSSTSFFDVSGTDSDIGNQVHLTLGSEVIRCTILDVLGNSPTEVSVRPNRTVPVAMRNAAVTEWALAVDVISNIHHLEGQDVAIFADGFVVANPNNSHYVVKTVTSGAVTLDNCYGVIHVGLPITSDLKTLNIDTAQGETIADKSKIVNKVSLFVEDTRGIWVGANEPVNAEILEDLEEVKVRAAEGYDDPVALQTGVVDVNIKSEWNSTGSIFIRNVDPVPVSILAVVPAGHYPFTGGK